MILKHLDLSRLRQRDLKLLHKMQTLGLLKEKTIWSQSGSCFSLEGFTVKMNDLEEMLYRLRGVIEFWSPRGGYCSGIYRSEYNYSSTEGGELILYFDKLFLKTLNTLVDVSGN